MTSIPITAGCILLLAQSSTVGGGETARDLSAFEPPALRDIDDRLVDLMDIGAGEERNLGDFMTATGHKVSIVVVRRGPDEPEPLRVECLRDTDRCLAVIHGDGTAELHRTRMISCKDAEGAQEPSDADEGIIRRPVKRNGECFEDLRVMAPATEE